MRRRPKRSSAVTGAHWLTAALLAAALAHTACMPARGRDQPTRTLVLLSIDGFRHDFRDRGRTPHLDALAARGIVAERLQPVFPTKTFPNHFTIVTGLYPERHGLVANTMYDPEFDATYSLGNRREVGDARWYDAEPIWVTAERRGIPTAPVFWPGSEAPIGGIRPTWWEPFDGSLTDVQRVDRLLELLDEPEGARPRFLTLYFNSVDDAAHRYGPLPSPQLRRAVEAVDRAVGRVLDGLAQRQLLASTDLVVISDHGMASSSRERVILIDRFLDLQAANPVDWDPVLALWPSPEVEEEVFRSLAGAHPRLRVYRRTDIPASLHYSDHRRVPPIIAIADEGWAVTTSSHFSECESCFTGGNHGFDPSAESMGGIFIAAGPSFRRGLRLASIESIVLYQVMTTILGVEPAVNGTNRQQVVTSLLVERLG